MTRFSSVGVGAFFQRVFRRRRINPFRSLTLWVLLLCGFWLLLQVFPPTGVILMVFGASALNTLLFYALIVAFSIDCFIGPMPLVLAPLPLVFAGGFGLWYKVEYDADWAAIAAIEAELQSRNVSHPVPFDPATLTLIANHDVLLRYRIPQVYSPGLVPFRYAIKPMKDCTPSSGDGTRDIVVYQSELRQSYCVTLTNIPMPRPALSIESDDTRTETIAGHTIEVTTTKALVDGKVAAQFVSAKTRVLFPFPIPAFGCFLVDNPGAWRCSTGLGHSPLRLDTIPGPGIPETSRPLEQLVALVLRSSEEIDALTAK